MLEKILIKTIWNVAGALHKLKGRVEYEKVPYGHVKVVFS